MEADPAMSSDANRLYFSNDPTIRQTYRAHLLFYILAAPFTAMINYAPFLAVKTFDAAWWAPLLTAIISASHLLAILFTRAINRSDKTSWVVWPTIISNLIFVLLIWADREHGWIFAMIIIFSLTLRAPIIAAQSTIFRINYPP